MKNSYTDVRNISDNLNDKTSRKPETSQQTRRKSDKLERDSLSYRTETDDGEKVMRDDREKYQVYPEEEEEKDKAYLDWLDRVEHMLSEDEKALVYRANDQVYIESLLSNKKENYGQKRK